MITRLEDQVETNRHWNGRDDNHQHYFGRIPLNEHQVLLSLTWKKKKGSPSHLVDTFQFGMPMLVAGGLARQIESYYVLRFQRTDRKIEVSVNRASPALFLAPLPSDY